jgi:Phage minor capsid protein 2
MAARPDAYAYEQSLAHFDAIVTSAQRTIVAQIEAAISSGGLRTATGRRTQLAAIDATLQQLTAATTPLARQLVLSAWHQAADRAEARIANLPIDTSPDFAAFHGVSTEAVQAMQDSLVKRLDSASQTLGRRVEDVYAREQRRAALRALLGAGGSPSAAAKQLQRRLTMQSSKDAAAFVDSAGRRWSLGTYANMAVRTVTREAVVQGAMARMASHGIAVARVSTHATSCAICLPFEGTLVAIGGADISEYRGEAVSDTGEVPPYHPNCAHSLEPVSATIDAVREELETAVV